MQESGGRWAVRRRRNSCGFEPQVAVAASDLSPAPALASVAAAVRRQALTHARTSARDSLGAAAAAGLVGCHAATPTGARARLWTTRRHTFAGVVRQPARASRARTCLRASRVSRPSSSSCVSPAASRRPGGQTGASLRATKSTALRHTMTPRRSAGTIRSLQPGRPAASYLAGTNNMGAGGPISRWLAAAVFLA
jgi:hypothetical protein